MSFRCEGCGLSRWYPLNQLDDVIQCAGCLNVIQPPARTEISFKLNELASRAIKQGAIPVLLTQRFLSMHYIRHTLVVFGLKAASSGQNEVEIDLVTTYKGQLVLSECKNLEVVNSLSRKSLKDILKQLSQIVNLARQLRPSDTENHIKSPLVLLATLLPTIPQELVDRVVWLNRSTKVAVNLVDLRQMKLVDLSDPSNRLEPQNLLYVTY
jgi:hypothetical protein